MLPLPTPSTSVLYSIYTSVGYICGSLNIKGSLSEKIFLYMNNDTYNQGDLNLMLLSTNVRMYDDCVMYSLC